MQKGIGRLSGSLVLAVGFIAAISCADKQSKPGETATPPATAPSPMSASTGKVKEAIEQITAIVNNVREWKARSHNYTDLSQKRAAADGIFPKQMLIDGNVNNPWGGPVAIDPVPGRDTFVIVFSNVPRQDCVQLYSQAKSLFTVHAGSWGMEPATEEQAKSLCETGNMWFIPK